MEHSNRLILGSQSPRRKELLLRAGFEFEVENISFSEIVPSNLPVFEVAEYLAVHKNKTYRKKFETAVVITADTVVISNNKILGKPGEKGEAINMLSKLSGNTHEVVTGTCISDSENHHAMSTQTQVKVKGLSTKEIDYYIKKFCPFDKAGSYGIQEWFGLIAIEWIRGSYYNVVGLPVDKVYKVLTEEFGITPN